MVELFWSERFTKNYRKWVERHPELREEFADRIRLFAENPFSPRLKTHSLSGNLQGLWAFSINYHYRLVFQFPDDDRTKAILEDIGTHDEVY